MGRLAVSATWADKRARGLQCRDNTGTSAPPAFPEFCLSSLVYLYGVILKGESVRGHPPPHQGIVPAGAQFMWAAVYDTPLSDFGLRPFWRLQCAELPPASPGGTKVGGIRVLEGSVVSSSD